MIYKTKFIIPFKSINEIDYMIEIQEKNYLGEPVELTGSGESAFSVKIDDESFLYTPTRFSTATIRIVGSDYLQQLYSTGYQQFKVIFKRNNSVIWTGFVSPELYTQDYTSISFELEIECLSAMSVLEYIDYKQFDESERKFVSLFDLIKKCVNESLGDYRAIYIPHVYSHNQSAYNNDINITEHLTVSEQNFFDEDDKAMTLKEVLEEVCKFLNWTCVDWLGSLYFIDADHYGKYFEYSSDFKTKHIVYPNELKVQSIGFSGSNHTLDILNGYNKATVRVSNYNVSQIFPDEDFDKLKRISEPWQFHKDNNVYRKIILEPSIFKLYQYGAKPAEKLLTDEEFKKLSSNEMNNISGAIAIKRCNYELMDGKPSISNYNYESMIQVRNFLRSGFSRDKVLLTYSKRLPTAAYSDGAIAINCSIEMSTLDDNIIEWEQPLDVKLAETPYLICALSIGQYHWNGSRFVNGFETFKIEFNMDGVGKGNFTQNVSTKTLDMPYDGLDGYIVPLPAESPLTGELKFSVINLVCRRYTGIYAPCFLKDLKLKYQLKDEINTEENTDRIYENIVNENFINELEEIEFKISTYNNDGLCYGKAFLDGEYLRDNLYSIIENQSVRLEEHLIRRIVRQYQATKYRLNQILINDSRISPITVLTDDFMYGKRFIVSGGEIDFATDQFNCNMIEI